MTASLDQPSSAIHVETWTLLVYTVPASPTSKRAAVWREVKRLGAPYLRDGVCALPDTAAARTQLTALAERVLALGGQATMIWDARLWERTADALVSELVHARRAEYQEVAEAAAELLQHIRAEGPHHSFDRTARASLTGDLGRLRRWLEQIVARDYLETGGAAAIEEILSACHTEVEQHAAASGARGYRR